MPYPPKVYEAIKEWVCKKYGLDPDKVVRPFYPQGNYTKFDYPKGYVVIDNPPFSILSEIATFYQEKGIKFFLFAPSLTCLTKATAECNHIITDTGIVYENGAAIKTSFLTNLTDGIILQTAPDLCEAIEKAGSETKKRRLKYTYPDHVLTAATAQKLCRYGVNFEVKRKDSVLIERLDSQKPYKKAIYSKGLLLSEKAAAEKAAAEKAAAEKAAAEKAAAEKAAAEKAAAEKAADFIWELSDREKKIVQDLG